MEPLTLFPDPAVLAVGLCILMVGGFLSLYDDTREFAPTLTAAGFGMWALLGRVVDLPPPYFVELFGLVCATGVVIQAVAYVAKGNR